MGMRDAVDDVGVAARAVGVGVGVAEVEAAGVNVRWARRAGVQESRSAGCTFDERLSVVPWPLELFERRWRAVSSGEGPRHGQSRLTARIAALA